MHTAPYVVYSNITMLNVQIPNTYSALCAGKYLHCDGGGGQRGGRGQAGLSSRHSYGGGTDDLAGQGGDCSQCGDGCDQRGVGAVHSASRQAGGDCASDRPEGGDTYRNKR